MEEVSVIMKQLIDGLFYLNSIEVVHQDLKPQNIFIHFPSKKQDEFVSDDFL